MRLLIVNVPRIATSPSLSPSHHPRPGWLLLPDPHARGGSWTRYPLRHPRPPVPTEEARRNRARLAAVPLSPLFIGRFRWQLYAVHPPSGMSPRRAGGNPRANLRAKAPLSPFYK